MLDGRLPLTTVERPANVRVATMADADQLATFLHGLAKDNWMGIPVSWEKVRLYVEAVCGGKKGIAGIIEEDGKIIGSVAIVGAQLFYSDTWFLSQVWCFVEPTARKGHRHYDALRDFCLWHQADMSARIGEKVGLETSVYSLKRLDAKTRLWGRKVRHVGSIFWREGVAS